MYNFTGIKEDVFATPINTDETVIFNFKDHTFSHMDAVKLPNIFCVLFQNLRKLIFHVKFQIII
jgi:hypothetical protein